MVEMELVATTVTNAFVVAAQAEGAATITTIAATIISAADQLQMIFSLQWRRPGSRAACALLS